MTPEQVRQIIREEMSRFQTEERFIFQKHAQFFDGRNIQVGRGTGTQIGTETDQRLGFFGVAPVSQRSAISAPAISSVSGTGDDATINSNFTANKNAINSLRTALSDLGFSA